MAQQAILDALSTVVAPEHLQRHPALRPGGPVPRRRPRGDHRRRLVLIYTGSRVFVELDDSFDVIWRDTSPRRVHPVLASLQSRLLALLMMVLLGVLLIAVIVTSVAALGLCRRAGSLPGARLWIGPAISGFTHYGILTGFFTLIYKWLPTGGVPWRFALVSGAVNSLLFAVGNRALVYYFEVTQITSAFGATAGFAAIMVWMYWTSLTILIGAQVGRATRDVIMNPSSEERIEVPEDKI